MADSQERWLEEAISDGYINYLEYNKFTDHQMIDSGAFGTIFKCEWKDCKLTVVLKCATSSKKKNLINELKILRKVYYHPNIIRFYGVTKDHNEYYNIILQCANQGNLRIYLEKKFMKLQWTDKLRIAKEIVDGLSFLHDNDIIHNDLHPRNILIHENRAKIADFDVSGQTNDMSMTSSSTAYGMPAYIDPQCFIAPNYKRDKKSDVYSFGVILWEISSGRPPFQSFENNLALAFHISKGIREVPIEGTPPQYVKLYEQCWDDDPANRPETKLVLNTLILENMREEARECFRQCKFLRALELFEQILGHSQHSLEDQKSASTWVLSYSRCESEKINELTKALCKNTTLTSLDLKSNELGSGEVKVFANALCKNTTLTTLDLSWNEFGPEAGKTLADALCKNTTLTSLNLYVNNLGSEGGKALADALYKNTTLTSLDLWDNNLGSEGGRALADALRKNTTLKNLNLGYNKLGSEGGKALADALRKRIFRFKNTMLVSLDLGYNNFGSEGGKALANALCENTTLTFLNLSYNNLGSEGGVALADALCKNTTMTILNLSSNNIGSEGGKALANALCNNTTLTSLDLKNNELGLGGGKALVDTLCKNVTLTSLDIQYNNINFILKSNNPSIEILQ